MKSELGGTRVLLLEGFTRQSMPMMEALRKLDCFVTTYNARKSDMGYLSHFPDRKIIGPWNRDDEDFSYGVVLDLVKSGKYDVVIPLTDFSATMLSKHKEELLEYTRPAVNNWDVFQKASDKLNTMVACMDNGVPCPDTLRCSNVLEDVLGSEVSYPLVIKPRVGYGSIGFHRVESEEKLKELFQASVEEHGPMLVQEYVPQTGKQYKCEAFIDANGALKSAVVFDKTRWYPIDGGSTCCSTTVDRPDVVESSVNLLKAIGWRGYADVDLIEDPRDSKCKVMEINPRITASVKVCFEAGVDFARQIVEFETGRKVTAYPSYKTGKTLRYLHTDALWFVQSPNRLRSDPSWFSLKNTTDQIFSLVDPLPWFGYTLQGLQKFGPEMKKRKR